MCLKVTRFVTDIEDLTQKTGNAKKFPVFVKMLSTALSKVPSETVFVDLLTHADLETLKARKTGRAPPLSAGVGMQSTGPHASKRYLILSYVVEFDKCALYCFISFLVLFASNRQSTIVCVAGCTTRCR